MRIPQSVRLLATLGGLFASACATPVPYYADQSAVLPAIDERHRPGLEGDLADKIAKSGILELEIVDANGSRRVIPVKGKAPPFEQISLAALEAAAYGAATESRGAEFDLLVRQEGTSPGLIVTVRHDLDRRLIVLEGNAPVSLDGPSPASAELQQRFGIGPLVDGGVSWTAEERRALETSLDLLAPEELAYLQRIPFRRDAGDESDPHAGYYVFEEDSGGGLIILLNRAFDFDGVSFVGTPQRAFPASIAVILHEIGHAVAKLDRETLLRIYERDRLAYNEAIPASNESWML